MKCPYCEEEMMEGYMYNGKEDIRWTPAGEKSSMFINHATEKEVLLAKLNYLKGCRIKVFRCHSCKIEIINEKDV